MALRSPDQFRCVGCGYFGAPPSEVQSEITAAAEVLAGLDAKSRQLSSAQRRSLRRSAERLGCLRAVFAILLAPLATCGLCGGVFLLGESEPTLFLAAVSPLFFFATAGGLILWLLGRQRRRLEWACAAVAPSESGQGGVLCHICGADLPPPQLDDAGIVRCGYCSADNLVDPKVLLHLRGRREVVLSSFAEAVRREAAGLGAATGLGSLAIVGIGLGTPALMLAGFHLGYSGLSRIEEPVDHSVEYVLAAIDGQRCVARLQIRYPDGRAYVHLGGRPPHGARGSQTLTSVLGQPTFPATHLVGRFVWFPGRTETRRQILRVYRPWLQTRENWGVFLSADGHVDYEPLLGACIDPVPTDLPAVPWT